MVDSKLTTNCAAVYPVIKEKNKFCTQHKFVVTLTSQSGQEHLFTYLETNRNDYHTNAFIVTHKHRIWADYCNGGVW